jgi:YD repeat-containing protein
MKIFFAFAFLASLVTPAAAQGVTTNFYAPDGRKVGSSTTIGNTTQFYDDRGRKVQSSTTTGNTTNFYDDRGRRTGSASTPTVRK